MKIQKNSRAGYTLIDIIVLIFIIVFLLTFIRIGLMGDHWFTVAGVLNEARQQDPKAKEVFTYQRNFATRSEVTIRFEDGSLRKYWLDSDLLFRYDLRLKVNQ